jgi:hypothetical protein
MTRARSPIRHVRRLLVAGALLAAAAVAALVGLGVGAASPEEEPPATPRSSGIHLWEFDGRPKHPTDAAYARTVAEQSEIVIGREGWHAYLDEMHDARPGVRVGLYRSGIAVGGEELAWVRANHPGWLLRDADGRLVKNEWRLYLVNPASDGVRAWRAKRAVADARRGYDVAYLDALGLYGLLASSGVPIDPRTGEAFTPDSWITATAGLARAVSKAVDVPLIANGLRDGRAYYGRLPAGGEFIGTRHLVDSIQGGVFEGCFRSAMEPIDAWPTEEDWVEQVNAIADVDARGKWSLCLVKTWTDSTAAERQQWHDYALASVLLGGGVNSQFHFSGEPGEPTTTLWPNSQAPLGKSAGSRFERGGAYLRRFANGIVVVNPGESTVTVDLGGTYRTLAGDEVDSVRMRAHTGVVLVEEL